MRHPITSRKKFFFIIPVIILFAISALVMWLWNMILPDVLNVKTISYWQAMGILILSKILFGGFHGFKKNNHHKNRRDFIRKMKNMTPEEREQFKTKWKQHFKNQGFCRK